MTRTRGDALQLVGMNTKTGAATAIGIPRDSWVSIPGYGSDKINAALYFGGPQLLGRDGRQPGRHPARLRVRHPVQVLRGDDRRHRRHRRSTTRSRSPTHYLKPKGFRRAGIHLGGYDALAFSRIRHNLLRRRLRPLGQPAAGAARHPGQGRAPRRDAPGFIERGVLTVMQHMHTDLSPAELFRLAQAVAQVEPAKITTCVVQGGIGNIGGASVVLPYVDQARRSATRPARTRRSSTAEQLVRAATPRARRWLRLH